MNRLKKNKLCQVILLSFLFLITGCGSLTGGEQKYFVLKSSNQADISFISGEPKVSIRRVKIPDYLKQRTIVRRYGNEQIKSLKNEYWAETLNKTIPTVLAQELSISLISPVEVHPLPAGITVDTIVEIEVYEFLGDSENLFFKASYRMVKPKKLQTRNFSTQIKLTDTSTLALVNGHQKALKQLALDISKHL